MSKIDDPVRWERILRAVIPDDAEWLSNRFEEPCQKAHRRFIARAQALRAARLVIAPGLRPRPAAEVIAIELQRYLASAWTEQQRYTELPSGAFERHRVLHHVAVLNRGKAIKWRTVCKALRVARPAKD